MKSYIEEIVVGLILCTVLCVTWIPMSWGDKNVDAVSEATEAAYEEEEITEMEEEIGDDEEEWGVEEYTED